MVLLTLSACDSGDGDGGPDLTGTWAFTEPVGLPDNPFFVRIAASAGGYTVQTWTYYGEPNACYFKDDSEDARLTHLGGDRYRSEEGGDVEEVRITVSGDRMTVRNGTLTISFTRSDQTITPVCEEDPFDDGGEWAGTVSATVDGQVFSASEYVTFWWIGTDLYFIGTTIEAGRSRHLEFSLSHVIGPGSYPLEGERRVGRWGDEQGSVYRACETTLASASAGSVQFAELTRQRAQGTFAFSCPLADGDTVEVSDGQFDFTRIR